MASKKDDASPAEKILALYTMLLVSKRAISLSELADRLNCSKQTVGRLVDKMEGSRFGKILREQQGREVAYRLEKPSTPPAISINAEGLAQLALCRQFLLRLLPPGMNKLTASSLEQASAYAAKESPVAGIGGSWTKGRIDYAPFENILDNLAYSIGSSHVCRVRYRARRNGEVKTWSFAPKRLLAYHDCLYVIGYRVTDSGPVELVYEDVIQTLVQRFVLCEETERSSAHIPEPPIDQIGLGIMRGKPFDITVDFKASSATYAAERQWSVDQRVEDLPDGGVRMRLRAENIEECLSWLLSFGPTAHLLEPDWLVRKLKQRIDAMAEMYAPAPLGMGEAG